MDVLGINASGIGGIAGAGAYGIGGGGVGGIAGAGVGGIGVSGSLAPNNLLKQALTVAVLVGVAALVWKAVK